uniref:Uncharacterized protein n=1 Tax=Panagrolaimus superbus TaxID=310955 RepID=A0A914YYG2_9BILA
MKFMKKQLGIDLSRADAETVLAAKSFFCFYCQYYAEKSGGIGKDGGSGKKNNENENEDPDRQDGEHVKLDQEDENGGKNSNSEKNDSENADGKGSGAREDVEEDTDESADEGDYENNYKQEDDKPGPYAWNAEEFDLSAFY